MAKKILIVDDEEDVLETMRMALEGEGYNVVACPEGLAAMQLARKQKPDLVLLDIMMPNTDGFDVLTALQEMQDTYKIPVMMVTGLSGREFMQKAGLLGSVSYLVKPFDMDVLIRRVRELVGE